MATENPAPKADARTFVMRVSPNRACLSKAIEADGFCDPSECWHKVAVAAVVADWDKAASARVFVDAGHIRLSYKGWRYVADTPKHVKRSLMLFDAKLYEHVRARDYTLRFRRGTRIKRVTKERQKQINVNRAARIAAGSDEGRRVYPSMRKRVEGFSAIV